MMQNYTINKWPARASEKTAYLWNSGAITSRQKRNIKLYSTLSKKYEPMTAYYIKEFGGHPLVPAIIE